MTTTKESAAFKKLELHFLPQAKACMGTNDMKPFTGLRVVITGATAGLGMGLTRTFINMGATVYAMGRSRGKLDTLKRTLLKKQEEQLVPVLCELSDLSSVKQAAEDILHLTECNIDVLVNNAGIVYTGRGVPTSAHGFDSRFTVNYLSHFVLTEKLVAAMKTRTLKNRPTVINISSTIHWSVSGSDLIPSSNSDIPTAAIADVKGIWQDQRAYANSKLAQLLASRALQRRHPSVRFVSVCPAWMATHIMGSAWSPMVLLTRLLGFQCDGWAQASTLAALMDNDSKDDYYVNNGVSDCYGTMPSWYFNTWTSTWGIRDLLGLLLATCMLLLQKILRRARPAKSSWESYDMNLQEDLYNWTRREVEDYL